LGNVSDGHRDERLGLLVERAVANSGLLNS
jgi:hypothetical protein